MYVNNVSSGYTAAASAYKAVADETKNIETEDKQSDSPKEDTVVKSPQYKMDAGKVSEMKAELNKKTSAFRMMVQSLLGKQGDYWENALKGFLDIDIETQEAAKAAIADDGEWGVEAVAKNIVDFAKALTGGDPGKIEEMRDAFVKGFKEAEKVWGGKLPEISQKTYDRVMELFDDWGNEGKESNEGKETE